LVLILLQLLNEKVALSEGQLLAVFTLHDCLIFVEVVGRERVELSERVEHRNGFPLNWEVVLVRKRLVLPAEDVRLKTFLRRTCEPSESLIATTFVDGENQVNLLLRMLTVPYVFDFLSWAKRGRPDSLLYRNQHRL